MARASKKAWISLAVSAALGVAHPAAAQQPTAGGVSPPPGVTQVRQGRAQSALETAIQCNQRGEYELAATWFQQAQASQAELSEVERTDLTIGIQLNNSALKSRRDSAELVRKADQAAKAGRTQDAVAQLQAAAAHQQFMTVADKQTYRLLESQLRPNGTAPVNVATHARAKLQQARILLTQGSLENAEAMAREVEQMGLTFPANEDSPRKLLDDVARARRGRPAETTVAARSSTAGISTVSSGSGMSMPSLPGASVASNTATRTALKGADVARQLMKDSRQALKAGDLTGAMKMATEARAYKQDLNWWDENPDKLITEIQKAEATRRTTSPQGGTTTAAVPAADPKGTLRKARELYAAGNLNDAERLAQEAAAARGVNWGLFGDTPDKLLIEVRKALQKRDQEQSVRLLADARRLYESANSDPQLLAQALEMTNKAERLHGPYGAMDFGDKPAKLRVEIETAQARNRQRGVTPTKPANVANIVEPGRATVDSAMMQASHTQPSVPPPAPPIVLTANEPKPLPRPEPVRTPVEPPPVLTPPAVPVAPAVPVVDQNKEQALRLLAEARKYQAEGKVLEARQLVLNAQAFKATFLPQEETPELMLAGIAAQALRQVDALTNQGTELSLTQASQLAAAFGFDAKPIESRRAALRQPVAAPPLAPPVMAPAVAQGMPPVAPPVPTQVTPPAAPQLTPPAVPVAPISAGTAPVRQRGEELLHQARLELRRGETAAARRFTVEAYTGNFGVQAEAEKLLHSIDAEEFNQRIMAANRSYEAGISALQRQDTAQAVTIFRTIEPSLLAPEKQTKLRELLASQTPAPGMTKGGTNVTQVQAPAAGSPSLPTPGAAPAPAAAPASDNYAQTVKALQDVKFQQLREEGIRVQKDALDRFTAGDMDRALEMLDDHLATLRNSQLEPQRIALLRRPLEVRKENFKTFKAERELTKLQTDQRLRHGQIVGGRIQAEENKNKQVAELMKQFNALHKEGKYREAEMMAMRAQELDPENPNTLAAVGVARMAQNQLSYDKVRQNKEAVFREGLNDAENPGQAVTSLTPIQFDPVTMNRIKDRKQLDTTFGGLKSEKDRQIERQLHTPVNLEFKNAPLEKAISDLQEMTGINIHLDRTALREAGVQVDAPVTVSLAKPIALKSALSLLLKDAGLMYHIEDEVLKVTTPQQAKGKLVTRTIPVADLVLPIENYTLPTREQVLRTGPAGSVPNLNLSGSPLGRNAMRGEDVSPGTLGSEAHLTTPRPGNAGGWVRGGAKGTIEDLLMKLITNTVSPNSWSEMGGPGTIDYYPLGMALIVNQTPDIQEQIQELLTALRRLQDQEVAVEIRFVTIAESFFERIGLDFNVNIKTNNTRYEPQITTQQFKPFGFINDFEPKGTVIGLTPAGSFTSDLDIPIRSSSFAQAIPPFGAFPNIPGGNGGLELGLAFLSDIQVFLFMEAAQGDQRTNVMQAPKLTLHNGQTATISIEDQQYFVTNVTATQAGGQIVFTPTNSLLPIGGTSITIQAVISADRRFVRLSLTPTLTNLASAVVQLFPITTFITPVFENGAQGQPVPFTQFLQQPVFNTVSVNTTVAVPDGGTVLLGGLKRLSEGRNEFGPPILSKLPYINRLFKNVGYGREAESLLMMVTPRIIINEEEEEKFLRQNPPATGQPLP